MILVAVLASLLLDRRTGGAAIAVALGLFGALLTAITLVLILTLDVDSRWPTLHDVVEDSLLTRWFLLAMVAVTLAAFAKDSEATWLSTLALTLAIAAGILGSVSLYHLFRVSTGEGRQHFLGSLLGRRIAGSRSERLWGDLAAEGGADLPAFETYFARLEKAIDDRDVTGLRDRVFELATAGEAESPRELGTLLALDLRVLRELGRAVVLGRIDSPEVGSVLLPELGRLLVDHSGQLLVGVQAADSASRLRSGNAQLLAAAHLGQAARLLAWTAGSAYSEAVDKHHGTPALKAVASGSVAARAMLLDAADPDGPDPLPPAHPWHEGLSEPMAALVWWWCMCDLNGAHDGRAFYAVIAALTGEKFFGSFGWGDRYLLSELEDRLSGAETSEPDDIRTRANIAVEALGGVRGIALELLTTSMACWRDRRAAIPDGMEQNWTYWEDPVRMARRARLFLPRAGDPWLAGADDALHALARLVSGGHTSTSLAAQVKACLTLLAPVTWPPVTEPQRRPGAAVLAVALHLAPRYERDSSAQLERFLRKLPAGLLEGALALGETILGIGAASPSSSSLHGPTQRVIQLLTFIQYDPQAEQG